MAQHADVVVIGAGLGGLAAAVTAAGEAREVVVLEHHTVPGGYAQCFQRGPYRFDASLHALNGLSPGGGMDRIWRDLDIFDRVRIRRLDPLYVARFPDREVVAHADPYRYEAALATQFPNDVAGIRDYLDDAFAVHREARRLGDDEAARRVASPDEFVTRYPSLVRASTETWAHVIRRHVHDDRLVAVFGALWGYVGLPPELVSGLVGTITASDYGHYGGWYPEGSSGAVSWALEQVLRERGGEIHYGQTVSRIEVRDGHAVAVETASGLRIEASIVISNASAPGTIDMVGREHLPADYVQRVDVPGPSCTTFSVYLGLDRDVFAAEQLPHELFLAPSYNAHATWLAALAGEWAQAPIAVTDYTRADPGCAPEGGGCVVLTVPVSWDYGNVWGTHGDLAGYHENSAYRDVKERVADELVRIADRHVPGLAASVRLRDAATPLTNFSYTRNPSGAIEGYENTPANSGLGWLPQTTPIANLFLAGAWTNTGGQNPAISSGRTAAKLALRTAAAAGARA